MTPVTLSFLSVLEDLFVDILNNILLPVLMIAFDFLWDLVGGMLMSFLSHLFFKIFVLLLKILLILERVFDVFSCNVGVYKLVNGKMVATSGYVDVSKNYSLLDVLMQSDYVTTAVLGMTAGAFALCFIVTIFAVIKSIGEGLGEMKRPVSHVIRMTARSCLIFALIPIVCVFVVRLAGLTIASVALYMPNNIEGGSRVTAAKAVSEALSNNTDKPKRGSKQSNIEKAIAAAKTATPNADTRACDLIFYLSVKDALRNKSNEAYYLSGQHFQNEKAAYEDVDVSRINWLYAFFETGLVLIIFLKLIIECMTRVFMILILYVVSPYFVAMMPLDDGAKFKKWKEMFVGFTISVFGPILSMKLYLVLLPYIVTNGGLELGFKVGNYAQWSAAIESAMTGTEIEAVGLTTHLFRLFFIAAGGFAVYKSQNLMLDLINPEVSKYLHSSSSVVDSVIMGSAKQVGGYVQKGINMIGGKKDGEGQEGGKEDGGGDGNSGGGGEG